MRFATSIPRLARFSLGLALVIQASTGLAQQGSTATQTQQQENPVPTRKDTTQIREVVKTAFAKTHDGWSSDEVILQDELNTSFIKACSLQQPNTSARDFNWTLINLRKAGLLDIKATKRNRVDTSNITHIAEMACRSVLDRFQVSTDEMMADPKMKRAFDEEVASLDSEVDLYLVRRSAFQLRKTRQLRPELITRIADWGRSIQTHSAAEIKAKPDLVPEAPGIYIFRDETGYLYIGQTDDLRSRLATHLDQSHSKSLAGYLTKKGIESISIEFHSFDPKSQARKTMVRRAYESELISSRKPRFNIQP